MPPAPHRNESQSASPWFSPGLVQTDETLLRTVLDPEHLEPDGKLKPAAIDLKDIRFRGWSVDRKLFTSKRQLRLFHAECKKKSPSLRKSYVLPVSVSQFRQLNASGTRDFVVIDAALWGKPAHAAILSATQLGESAARKLRTDLMRVLPKYVEVDRAFDPADKFGYVRGMCMQLAAIVAASCRFVFQPKA